MFLQYYGLREQPFGVTPNPRYLYHSPMHREALASLIYGIEADLGFAALIADPGMGKTTLLFYLLEKFRATARTALIFQTLCSPLDLLRYLASELEIQTTDTDPVILNERIKDVLVQEAQARRRVIVIIDEAQNLDEPVLETIRLLSDFETQNFKLLHIILAGQLQLAEKLSRPGMAQLLQRVSMLNRLSPLTPEETKNYVEYRLGVAGYRGGVPLFEDDAIELIASLSGGIPRNINRICFNALSLGCALGKQGIDSDVVKEVRSDLDIGELLYQKGAITDETQVAASRKETIAEGSNARGERPPARVPRSSEGRPLEAAPAIQWPAFPVAAATRTAPAMSTDAPAARDPGLSAEMPAMASAGTAAVRRFVPPGMAQARPLSSAQVKPVAPPISSRPASSSAAVSQPTVSQPPVSRPTISQPNISQPKPVPSGRADASGFASAAGETRTREFFQGRHLHRGCRAQCGARARRLDSLGEDAYARCERGAGVCNGTADPSA